MRHPKLYAVNRRTKEYKLTNNSECNMGMYPHSKWKLVEADADGWIELSGGNESPMRCYAACDVRTKTGHQVYFKWACKAPWASITAYRPILNHPDQPKESDISFPDDTWPDKESLKIMNEFASTVKQMAQEMMDDIQSDKPKEWRGPEDGLPPVGTLCEVKHIGVWHQTTIVGIDEGVPVFKTDWCERYAYACGADFDFRPIRTDRERWIEAANNLWVTEDRFTPDFMEDVFGTLYDALKDGDLPMPEE